MRRTLPILPPMVKAYMHHGFATSMLNRDLIRGGWVYNKYMQLSYHKRDDKKKYLDFTDSNYYAEDHIFLDAYYVYPFETVNEKNYLIREIKSLIDRGYYIKGWWKRPQDRKRSEHLIYGYNDMERCLYVEGILCHDRWSLDSVSYGEYIQYVCQDAYHDPAGGIGFHVYKRNPEARGRISAKQLIQEAKEYTECGHECCFDFYGDAIDRMEEAKQIHLQSFSVGYEHKKMAVERMHYLNQRYRSNLPIHEAEAVYRYTRQMYSLAYEYNQSLEPDYASEMKKIYQQAMETEEVLLEKVTGEYL